MTSSKLHWEQEISWSGKVRKRTRSEFFSLLTLATTDGLDIWVFIDTHRSLAGTLHHKYEVHFDGPNALKMADRFISSLERMEELLLDYIHMVQSDSAAWVEHTEDYENDQQGDVVWQPGP